MVTGLEMVSLHSKKGSAKNCSNYHTITFISHASKIMNKIVQARFQFSHSVVSNSLQPHGLGQARPPCLSPTPGIQPNSCPLSRWCHPAIYLILCRPLFLLPPVPPSIRVFSKESVLRNRWPKDWSFSFNISSSNECSGLISFRMDWLDLLAVQRTLKSLL